MGKRKKAGRPKMAPEQRKVRFSVTLHPELIESIDGEKTLQKGRNRLIEETLEEKFLKK
jgi:hypothetical protein